MWKRLFLLTTVLTLLTGLASAETLILPDALQEISAEAFANDTAVTSVIVPDTTERIGAGAFRDCTQLREIVLPASVHEIAADAFDACHQPLLIRTSAGSDAMQFAVDHQLDYQADTTYRALLIGQTAYNYPGMEQLPGTQNDLNIMQHLLSQFGYDVTVARNLTGVGIGEAIASTFSAAQPQDVSLFFYAGHGASAESLGALCGIDGDLVTGALLRSWMDQIPGRKILIIDSCFSGNLIGRSTVDPLAQWAASMIQPFTLRSRSGELAADSYFVITAARSTQQSYEFRDKLCGVFTYSLGLTCGYNYDNDAPCARSADADRDGVITLQEAYQAARMTAYSLCSYQTAQVYPSQCQWFGIFRPSD